MDEASHTRAEQSPPCDTTSWRELALVFLRLGTTAFGGPAAHVAIMEDEFVRRRRWITHEKFLDLLGAVNLLPGPNSTEMAIYVGYLRGGWLGLVVAGVGFILPAMLMVTGIAWAYMRFGSLPQFTGILEGVKPVVIAVIFQGLWGLGRKAVKSVPLAIVALLATAAGGLGVNPLALPAHGRAGDGLAGGRYSRAGETPSTHPHSAPRRRRPARSRPLRHAMEECGSGGSRAGADLPPLPQDRLRVVRQRLRAACLPASRPCRPLALALFRSASGRHGSWPGDPRPAFHHGHVHRLRARRITGRDRRHRGNLSPFLPLRRRQRSPRFSRAEISRCRRILGWRHRRVVSAHGGGDLGTGPRGDDGLHERSDRRRQCDPPHAFPRQLRLAGLRRSAGRPAAVPLAVYAPAERTVRRCSAIEPFAQYVERGGAAVAGDRSGKGDFLGQTRTQFWALPQTCTPPSETKASRRFSEFIWPMGSELNRSIRESANAPMKLRWNASFSRASNCSSVSPGRRSSSILIYCGQASRQHPQVMHFERTYDNSWLSWDCRGPGPRSR